MLLLLRGTNPPISTLTDDFATADTTKWTFPSGASVSGGQLLEPVASVYKDVTSVIPYSLVGDAAAVQLVQRANAGNGSTETYLLLYVDNTNGTGLYFHVNAANLTAYRRISGALTSVGAITYDPVQHAWLKIRESGGTIFWDTSPDGQAWTNQFSWVTTFSVAALYADLGAGYYGTETAPGTAIWDNFNTAGGPTSATAAGSVTLSGTATASGSGTATGTVTLSASGNASTVATAAGSVTLTGSGSGRGVATASGAVTLSARPAASAPVTAAGSLSLTGSSAASARPTASGSVTLSGTGAGTNASINTATGSISLGGSVAAQATASATGSLTLAGTSQAAAGTAVAGRVTLGGSGSPWASAAASGAVTLAGAGQLSALANAAATVTLDGLGNATAGAPPRDITLTISPGRSRGLTAAVSVSRGLTVTPGGTRTVTATGTTRDLAGVGASRTLTAQPRE